MFKFLQKNTYIYKLRYHSDTFAFVFIPDCSCRANLFIVTFTSARVLVPPMFFGRMVHDLVHAIEVFSLKDRKSVIII